MKIVRFCLLLALGLGLVSACTINPPPPKETSYKKQSVLFDPHGYDDKKLSDNSYEIEVYATSVTGRDKMRDMAYRRAAELTVENGYSHFLVTKTEDYTRTTTQTMNGVPMGSWSEPLIKVYIEMYSVASMENEEGRTVFLADAAEILAQYQDQ